jgi:hypothetical protein
VLAAHALFVEPHVGFPSATDQELLLELIGAADGGARTSHHQQHRAATALGRREDRYGEARCDLVELAHRKGTVVKTGFRSTLSFIR